MLHYNKRWSEEDNKRLRYMRDRGISIREIAKELHRTDHAIREQLAKLGIKIKRGDDK